MSKKIRWLMLATGVLLHCGGKSVEYITDPDSGAATGGAAAVVNAGSGGTSDASECIDSGVPEGGCGGEAGDNPLQPYANLRTASCSNANVSRRGSPVSVCFGLK